MRPLEKKFYQRCQRFYQMLEKKLVNRHKGEVVAIEAESGEYVLGKDELDVALEAKKRFGKPVHFFRLGYEAVHKCRLRICVKRIR